MNQNHQTEAGRQACIGYRKSEIATPAIRKTWRWRGEGAARWPLNINFTVFGSGKRATIIGRAGKVIEDGEMVMAAMAVQYQGYVATVEYRLSLARQPTDKIAS
jgi:hypothetical protein